MIILLGNDLLGKNRYDMNESQENFGITVVEI
jgi:hypothetical protein